MEIILNTPPLNVYEHMALDEQTVRHFDGGFCLRFYNWTPGPAVTFGYAQFINEVEKELTAKQFKGASVRRPTGGGLVYHEEDLTFSCIWQSQEIRPADIYERLHNLIRTQLELAGLEVQTFDKTLPASAYAPSVNHTANSCFVSPVQSDLLAEDGQKILGGAIRRFGDTVLYQGSLQSKNSRQDARYRTAVIEAIRQGYANGLHPQSAEPGLLSASRLLAVNQYQTDAWTRRF